MSAVPFVKEGTFLHSYMQYMSTQETPAIYDFMCGCWILGAALGRSVVVDRPRAPVHMNMYVILISEAGIMRKSTSIRIATGLLREFFTRNDMTTYMIENKVSQGMLMSELSRCTRENGHAHCVLVASELASVLGRASNTNMPATLTDLYDCPNIRIGGGSLATGGWNFSDVFICFLGGSTPTWLARAVSPAIIEGGFTSRCYFIQGRSRKQLVPWPTSLDDSALRERMLEQLQEIKDASKTYAKIGIGTNALDTFSRWYRERDIHKDAYRESFESREDSHVLRFAGLAAANEKAWQISDDHIRRAINTVAEIKKYGTSIFTTDAKVGAKSMRLAEKMRTRLIKAGEAGIGRRDLYRGLFINGRTGDEFATLLRLFHELDLVKRYEVDSGGRPKELYVATEYLSNEAFLDEVASKLGV